MLTTLSRWFWTKRSIAARQISRWFWTERIIAASQTMRVISNQPIESMIIFAYISAIFQEDELLDTTCGTPSYVDLEVLSLHQCLKLATYFFLLKWIFCSHFSVLSWMYKLKIRKVMMEPRPICSHTLPMVAFCSATSRIAVLLSVSSTDCHLPLCWLVGYLSSRHPSSLVSPPQILHCCWSWPLCLEWGS